MLNSPLGGYEKTKNGENKMATNQYGQTYSGNDDFRGWIAAQPENAGFLEYVGNDGGFNVGKAEQRYGGGTTSSGSIALQRAAENLYNQWQSGRSGGVGNGGIVQQAADPYAKQRKGFMDQKNTIFDSARDAIGVGGRQLRGSILDFVDSFKRGQRNVDEAGINAALAKQQGMSGIRDMVGRGIKSGGVTLANKNSADSSAAYGIARAYGDVGRREAAGVGNEYEGKQRQIGLMQDDLMSQKANFERDYKDEKLNIIDNIVEGARTKLAALNEAMMGASLPDRIEIQKEADSIRKEAKNMLVQYDRLQGRKVSGVKPMSEAERRAQAAKRSTEGYDLGADAFSFTNEIPAEWQSTGPFSGEIPLFTFNAGSGDEQNSLLG